MRNFYLFLRRIAGIIGLVFGGRQAWEARSALKKLNARSYARRIVSDAVLLNDLPSPSEGERYRMEFITARLGEFGVSNVFSDDKDNVLALFPAFGTRRDFVLLVAEVGDANYTPLDNSVHLSGEKATGRGLGERSLGAAALLVFAEFAQATGFHLDKNLLILFTKSSSVDEREESFRHFLDGWADRISCAVLVRGTGLGVVETRQVGAYRLSVDVRTEERTLLSVGPRASAATILGLLVSRIGSLEWEDQQSAMVSVARLEAGPGFGHWATQGEMDVEIVAEDDKVLEALKKQVTEAIGRDEEGDIKVSTLVRYKRSVGDPKRNAPLLEALRAALVKAGCKAEPGVVSEKVSLLNERGIPAVAVGITKQILGAKEETVDLTAIPQGFLQLVLAIEGSSNAMGRNEE